MHSKVQGQVIRRSTDTSLGKYRAAWPRGRSAVFDLVEGGPMQMAIGLCIVGNTALVVVETDLGAACDGVDSACESDTAFIRAANVVFLSVYVAEMLLKLFVHRFAYFTSPSDCFDMFIVLVGVFGMLLGNVLPGVGILRLFRVVRVMRAVKITQKCDEVKVFISGIGSAAKAIVVGAVLIFFTLFLFAIAAVMLLNPGQQELVRQGKYNDGGCERCERAYASVMESMLTLLQTVLMGDAWGDFTVPIIEHQPWTVCFFVITNFTITLGLTNLVLAVIMDKTLENREVNLQKQAAEHAKELELAQQHFVTLCAEIDLDQSGYVTLQELLSGFEHPDFHAVLTLMDIGKQDLTHVFDMMDQGGSGQVSYEEFAMQLQSLKSSDLHTMCSFVKHYVFEIHDQVAELRNLLCPNEPRRKVIGEGVKKTASSDRPTTEEPVAEVPTGALFVADTTAVAATSSAVPRKDLPAHPSSGVVLRAQMQEMKLTLDKQATLLQKTMACELELRTSVLRALIPSTSDTCDTSAAMEPTEQKLAPAEAATPSPSEPSSLVFPSFLAAETSQSGAGASSDLSKFALLQSIPATVGMSGSAGRTRLPL